jgi:hypothetical protein
VLRDVLADEIDRMPRLEGGQVCFEAIRQNLPWKELAILTFTGRARAFEVRRVLPVGGDQATEEEANQQANLELGNLTSVRLLGRRNRDDVERFSEGDDERFIVNEAGDSHLKFGLQLDPGFLEVSPGI